MPQKPPGRPRCRKSLWQGRHEGFGGRQCLTLLSEATRKGLGKRPKCRKSLWEGQDAAKAFGKGATRESLREGQDAAKAFGKGATRDLEAG